jgi:site-specific DNA-methyltransferase (cytosine-N4-specific)
MALPDLAWAPFWTSPSGRGAMWCGDSAAWLPTLAPHTVDLLVTSPPFPLWTKKAYGNVADDAYLDWFRPFAVACRDALRPAGSLVLDLGGTWQRGQPTRSLYQFKLLLMLCEEYGFHLAQEFYWWNPAKLPTPAEWVTIRRVRVKDAVNTIWWLAPSPWPKASNRRVLQPYSAAMHAYIRTGGREARHPSGHTVRPGMATDRGGAIPPNLLALAHTESNSAYLRACRAAGLPIHPARFPAALPEYFVRMLTDPGDLVVDPFAGSCPVGEVCERLGRRWHCIEQEERYLAGALGRFQPGVAAAKAGGVDAYRAPRVGAGWDDRPIAPLDREGGRRPAVGR